MPSSASEEWKSSETAATRAMSTGLWQREKTRTRRSVGRSRRQAGGGVSGEGAAVAVEARQERAEAPFPSTQTTTP